MISISIIIPVRNGEATLEKCLSSIASQTIADSIEVIVLDSMSTDGSKKIAEKYNARIIDIPNGTFNHGLTRNLAIQYAQGDLLYFTVQDAWLSSADTIERFIQHFTDEQVMAVVGQQSTPWGDKDKNPYAWFVRYTDPEPEIRFFPDGSFSKLREDEQFKLINWDNVCAMYRKIALQKIPFRETSFCEDWAWAKDALNAGFKIIRDPGIVVYHYHHMLFGYAFKTKYIISYHFFLFFHYLQPIPWSPINFLKAVYSIGRRKQLSITEKLYWMFHNLNLNLAVFLSVFLFRISYFLNRNRLSATTYRLVCHEVPQGKTKK